MNGPLLDWTGNQSIRCRITPESEAAVQLQTQVSLIRDPLSVTPDFAAVQQLCFSALTCNRLADSLSNPVMTSMLLCYLLHNIQRQITKLDNV